MPTCKSCGRPVLWAETENGKAIPLDPSPVQNGNLQVLAGVGGMFPGRKIASYVKSEPGVSRYVSHFVTCPNAAAHRKGKE